MFAPLDPHIHKYDFGFEEEEGMSLSAIAFQTRTRFVIYVRQRTDMYSYNL